MYEVFDGFIAAAQWPTVRNFVLPNIPLHTVSDRDRFYQALHQVVQRPTFSPEDMAEYICEKLGVTRGSEDPRAEEVDYYKGNAWAIREYLKTIRAF